MAKAKAPKYTIDYGIVERMARIDCNDLEIYSVLGIPEATWWRQKQSDPLIVEAINRGRAQGNADIRTRMFDIAMSDHKNAVTMLIWLSKNRLGYTDKTASEIATSGTSLKVTVSADDLSDDELAQIIYNSSASNRP
jgi:hypothetical protein